MAAPVWGLLQKSLTDSKTIETRVDEKIAEHEADEDSHLGVGESLQSHKAAAIIDHLAESIITDKLANLAVTGPKITDDQIIAKDFRTALDVGVGVDGVKMAPAGIEMWQDGIKKVDIPISGNPYFAGGINRDDWHWFTVFESLSGYNTAGTVTINSYGIKLATGAVSGNAASLQKILIVPYGGFSWDVRRRLKFTVQFDQQTLQDIFIGVGTNGTIGATTAHIGFLLSGNALYGDVADGATRTVTNLNTTIGAGDYVTFETRYYPGVSIQFFVNGVFVGVQNVDFPSSFSQANYLLEVLAITNTNAIRSCTLKYWDLWQDVYYD